MSEPTDQQIQAVANALSNGVNVAGVSYHVPRNISPALATAAILAYLKVEDELERAAFDPCLSRGCNAD